MEQVYSVLSGEESVGTVWLRRQGLYYRIRCRCRLTGTVKYKLVAVCGENAVDLGLCVPYADGFGTDVQIPIKQIGEGELRFRLIPKHGRLHGRFVPVSPDEPFSYIRQLQNAHLARQDGHIGVILEDDQNSRDKPTGQWSDPSTFE